MFTLFAVVAAFVGGVYVGVTYADKITEYVGRE